MTERARSPPSLHSQPCRSTVAAFQTSESRQSPERKNFGIAVVAEVEDPGKACRGVVRLFPGAVVSLSLCEERDAARDLRPVRFARRHERKQRPRRLRRVARRDRKSVVVEAITVGALAPAAILV